nr:hypothetical protein [Actinoplanes utahensis]
MTGAGAAGDPAALLDLPEDLVAEAVISYADTAPAEVAEHLAPFVSAHSVVGAESADSAEQHWLDLMITAPAGADSDPTAESGGLEEADLDFGSGVPGTGAGPTLDHSDATLDVEPLDFPDDPIELDELDDWTVPAGAPDAGIGEADDAGIGGADDTGIDGADDGADDDLLQ